MADVDLTNVALTDASGTTRFRGSLTGTEATVPVPASVYLTVEAGIDVHDVDEYACEWTALFGRWTLHPEPLTAIPADLGLAFSFDGTAAGINATEAGVWAFTLVVDLAADDATFHGNIADGLVGIAGFAEAGNGPTHAQFSEVIYLDDWDSGPAPSINTMVQATADPLLAFPTLYIVRIS